MNLSIPQSMKRLRPFVVDRWAAIEDEITPTVRLGIGACIVLLAVYFLSVFAGVVSSQKQEVENLRREIELQRTSLEGIDWADRAEIASRLLDRAETKLWPGATSGLAQADFEKWLRDTFEAEGLAVTQFRVRSVPISEAEGIDSRLAGRLERISAKVLMEFDEKGFTRALKAIGEKDSFVIVRQVNARAGPTMRVEMDVDTFRYRGDGR